MRRLGSTAAALALVASLAARAQPAERGRDLPTPNAPRPERIVPPPQKEMIPPGKAAPRPEIRAGIEQRPVGDTRARITVRVIAAQAGKEGKDPRLEGLDLNLSTLPLAFGTYKLVDERTFDVEWNKDVQVDLPGSRSMVVTPREIGADGRVRVLLQMLGAHPAHATRMQTAYSIARGGTLMVGGYRLDPERPEKGFLIIAITQGTAR